MIPSYENKLGTVRRMRRYKKHASPSFVLGQNVIERCFSIVVEYANVKIIFKLSRDDECCSSHLFELPAKRFRSKINRRRVGWTCFTIEIDRLAVFIAQVGQLIEDKTDWRCKLLRIFQRSFKSQMQRSKFYHVNKRTHALILQEDFIYKILSPVCVLETQLDRNSYECFDTFITEKFISNWLMSTQKGKLRIRKAL